jgi:hypothetical protein
LILLIVLNGITENCNVFINLVSPTNGGIEMAQNEIAKLMAAYNKLWDDLKALYGDINRIIRDEYSWDCFEEAKEINSRKAVLFSYFSGTKILFFIVDAQEGILILALCSLNRKKSISVDWLKANYFSHKYFSPDKLYDEDYAKDNNSNKMPKKFSSSSCFDVFTDGSGDWLFSKVDLMSIDSTDKVNKDVKKLLDVMINGKYKNYDQNSSELKFM